MVLPIPSMLKFYQEQIRKIEMLMGLGLPEERAKKCALAFALDDDEDLEQTRPCAVTSRCNILEGAVEEVRKHAIVYCDAGTSIRGVLECACGIANDGSEITIMGVMKSPAAMDSFISKCFPHFAGVLAYCDLKSFKISVICDPEEVEYYRNRLAIFGAANLRVNPAGIHISSGGEDEDEDEDAGCSSLFASLALSGRQPNDAATMTRKEGEGAVTRCLYAEEKVFDIPLTRRLIMCYKIALEKNIRTDENIRKAVKKWLEDPVAAEKWYCHISNWDVSRVTDMSRLFYEKDWRDSPHFNEDLSKWQTGNVTNMSGMFAGASFFKSDLSQWQVGNVTDLSRMFDGASSFTSDLSGWQTDKVTDMSWMFNGLSSFTSDLSEWQTGNVTNMSGMFHGALVFKSDLSRWETGKVTNMSEMFAGATSFTSDLSQWQTGNVTNMSGMFHVALSFTSDLSKWQTSKETNTRLMFAGTSSLQEKPLWYTATFLE